MREAWTDERLDDLNHRVDDGFRRVDQDIRDLRAEMNLRFDAMQRLIIQVGGGMLATMIVGFASVLVAVH